MPKLHRYSVVAKLPEKLLPLREIAANLWWTWDQNAINLFSRIAKLRPASLRLNPVELINSLSTTELESLLRDNGLLAQLAEVVERFNDYKHSRKWWNSSVGSEQMSGTSIAYFSLEFGLHETLPVYSGGLGVLAGDHLKAASDLGLPLVGVGLLYYEGYFAQYLNAEGWQQESYPRINPNRLPISPALAADGSPLTCKVKIREADVYLRAWRVDVGCVPLYLLDTNIPENEPQYRSITARLYGGDHHTRVQQELVLGVGGLKMLNALGFEPDVIHMNEGHSAFVALEQIRKLMVERDLSFEEARLATSTSSHFTTHTPVPAGNDVFPNELVSEYFAPYAKELGIKTDPLLRLGRIDEENHGEPFSMTVLALKTSNSANGVSMLHERVSTQLWQGLWPDLPREETPIANVTNGIHTTSWTSRDMAELYDRYLGPDWREAVANPETWNAVNQIPDEELWRIRCRSRSLLVQHCRERVKKQLERRGAGPIEIDHAGTILNPEALTIGFARRFAAYKRATLILQDIDRLVRLLGDMDRPVQFIFAGKAHPADQRGKELISSLVHAQHRPELRGRFVFLEDYDMGIARRLVHGVDVWLNNPRRPLEACGTSGMKVAVNGGLNMSVLDGWWCEAFDGANGWSIGQGEEYESESYHDQVESRSIYDLLEREVIPIFFDRNEVNVPVDWLRMAKHSIRTIAPQFSATRMVSEYAKDFYDPAARKHRSMVSCNFQDIRTAARAVERFEAGWQKLRILGVDADRVDELPIGRDLPVTVRVQLGSFSPEEIAVEVRYGIIDITDRMQEPKITELTNSQRIGDDGVYDFSGTIATERAGSFGLSVRVFPRINGKAERFLPRLVTWWE
ncbi:MAG: alpha-glucan family phosphorylase [Bdellovibrionales bacterium]|nr:alpha-glucan family phosphorylase [Bdellovibrionales bacterium]